METESSCMSTYFNISLVLATIGLVWATIKLAQYTKSLSALTERLVDIEHRRDEKENMFKRLSDLGKGLTSAEIVQRIYVENFAVQLSKPLSLPIEEMRAIENLQSLKMYVKDTDCHPILDSLCSTFDSVRREKGAIKLNAVDIHKQMRTLQERLQWFVDDARREISNSVQS
jgi:hypothetical protein